jgi:MYXO-CTERM domain-containing protein
LAAALAAVVLDQALGRAQGTPSDLSLFVGRFHPLVVHLPIGIFLLVGAAELGTLLPRARERIDPALALVLPLMALSALTAFLLGHLLARSGGFPPQLLLVHRRLALCAVLGSSLCLGAWTYHAQVASRASRGIYRVLLALSLGALSVGAHFGGAMTHGETYLSKYAPAPLKPLLGGAEPPVKREAPAAPSARAEPLLFESVVLPILRQRCVECHGAEKTKGKLRLDSLEGILKGGDHGAALASGNADDSLMLRRVLLPVAADEHMPPKGKPGLSPEQIAVLRFWIERGASPTFRVRDALAPPATRPLLEALTTGQIPTTAANPAEAQPAHSEPDPGGASQPSAAPAPESTTSTAPAHAVGGGSVAQILSAKCGKCHSGEQAKGGLRLNSLARALEGGEDGPVVVPGNPGKSSIVQRIQLPLDDEDHMPPEDKPQLARAELAAIVAWVRTGAQAAGAPASRSNAAAEPASAGEIASTAGATRNAAGADGGVASAGSSEPAAPAAPPSAVKPAASAERSTEPTAPGAPPQTLRAHPGGCGACAVGSAAAAPLGIGVGPLTLLALLAAWRPISRRRSQARRTSRRSRPR